MRILKELYKGAVNNDPIVINAAYFLIGNIGVLVALFITVIIEYI